SSGETPASPQDQNWPQERVQIWLAAHGFSKEWQAAFQHLNVHGALFLDIGRSGGQRNIGFMPQTVLPQVARECTTSGVMWDQSKEREESRRIRRLVRDVLRTGGGGTPATAATSSSTSLPLGNNGRRQSSQFLNSASAGTEGGVENSPNLARPELNTFGSTPTTAGGTGDDSPGRAMPPPTNIPNPRRFSGQRAVTLDTLSRSVDDSGRSGFSTAALSAVGDMPRRHSPSTSGEFASITGHKYASPQQSPGISSARPANGANSHRYYGHLRANSSETHIIAPGGNLSPGPGKPNPNTVRDFDGGFAKVPPGDSSKRRNATDGSRPPALETHGRQGSNETPVSASTKEHKGFLDKFRRNKRKDDLQAADEDISPASPQSSRHGPFARLAHAASETNLVENRPPSRKSAHTSTESTESIPPLPLARGRTASRAGDKKFVFVTPDGWNYRLIDITDVESAEQLRTVICYNLGVPEGPDVAIHVTNPGQVEHDEPLDDKLLTNARLRIADSSGSLKLYVRAPGTLAGIQEHSDLSLNVPQSPFDKASFAGKSGDEVAFDKLSEARLGSPSTVRSSESTLVPEKARGIQHLIKDPEGSYSASENSHLQENALQQDFQSLPENERLALLEAKAEEHRKETERKQKAYLEQRRNRMSGDPNGRRFHDFDNVKGTSYADARPVSSGSGDSGERRSDGLVPMRRPPPVPEPTSTLVKANSLTKKGPNPQTSWPNRKEEPWKRSSSGSIAEEEAIRRPPSRGIGAALAG
ncbi:hypothetical protein KC334_g17749, partial [Hortaea werneckii]